MKGQTWTLCIQIGSSTPYDLDLTNLAEQKQSGTVTIGRGDASSPWDITINSPVVSGSQAHGVFQWHERENCWTYIDNNSTNGTYINEVHYYAGQKAGAQKPATIRLNDGDYLRIDLPVGVAHEHGVHLIFKKGQPGQYTRHDLQDGGTTTIGRKGAIRLNSINAEDVQATIQRMGSQCVLNFANRYSGFVNGKTVSANYKLVDRDSLLIAGTLFQYAAGTLFERSDAVSLGGVMLRVRDLTRHSRGKLDHISFDIHKGELIGVIGSSGAGKSTLLNAISGNAQPDGGSVTYNGLDLIRHRNVLKNSIGFVPQKDIMHEKLTVESMLNAAARLRLRDNVSAEDRKKRVDQVITQLGLTQQRKTPLTRVSGGQKKRASIGIEMLSDPDLFFLDEPTSGLDPGTEKNLMITLRQLAQQGKSVVLITHSTLALPMCDKIIIVGRDGKMTYFGEPRGALSFFGVQEFGDIFDLITEAADADQWKNRFNQTRTDVDPASVTMTLSSADKQEEKEDKATPTQFSPVRQLFTLTTRYFKLILRDPVWLLCMLLVIPLAAAAIMSLMSNDSTLVHYTATYKVEFALICIAAFAGLMTSYNEICKEREVMEREASANLHFSSYILSKVVVLSCISLAQSLMMTAGFFICVGDPGTSQFLPSFMEIGFTTFLTTLAAACMGLLVSAAFKTGEAATQPLIIVLIMQVVFSGAIMELSGATRFLANFIFAFWGTNALAASTGLNNLPMAPVEGLPMAPATPDYDYLAATVGNMLGCWAWLIGISIVCVFAAFAILKWNKQLSNLLPKFRR